MLDSSLGGVLKQKRRAEAAVRASSLDWTIVRPGLLLQGASQGGVLLGEAGRWTGDAVTDRVAGMEKPVKCASPFVASGGAVCRSSNLRAPVYAGQVPRRLQPTGSLALLLLALHAPKRGLARCVAR